MKSIDTRRHWSSRQDWRARLPPSRTGAQGYRLGRSLALQLPAAYQER